MCVYIYICISSGFGCEGQGARLFLVCEVEHLKCFLHTVVVLPKQPAYGPDGIEIDLAGLQYIPQVNLWYPCVN